MFGPTKYRNTSPRVEEAQTREPSPESMLMVQSDIVSGVGPSMGSSGKVTPVPIPKYALSQRPGVQSLQREWKSRQQSGGDPDGQNAGSGGHGDGSDAPSDSELDEMDGFVRMLKSSSGNETRQQKMNSLKRPPPAQDRNGAVKRRRGADEWDPPRQRIFTAGKEYEEKFLRTNPRSARISDQDSIIYDTRGRVLHENPDETNRRRNDSEESSSSSDTSVDEIPARPSQIVQGPLPSTTQKALPVLARDQFTILPSSRGGRFYRCIEIGGVSQSTMGAPIPDGYRRYPDQATPWICPIRSCRRLLRSINALGGHFSAGHRDTLLNDNGDGTFSIVATCKLGPGRGGAMVISHNDPDPDEPPMAVPCVPINQRPMKADLIRAARQPWPRNIGAAVRRESPMRGGLKVTPVPIPSFDAGNANGRSGVREYLRGILSTKFNWQRSFRYDTETLLTLPRKRDLPQQYVDKWAGSPHLSKTAFLGLVMYLVGDEAESPCLGCHEPDPFEMCIVANEKFPPATTDYLKGSCAVCQFKYMKWHQKNLCSFIQDPDNMQLDDGYEHDPALSSVVPVDQRQYQREDNSSEVYADDSYALGLGVGSSTREEPDAVPERKERKQFMMTAKPGGFTSLKRRLRRAMNKPRQPPNAAQYDSNAVLLEPGQLMSAVENLEMEDWELAPGRIEDNDTSEGIAFSTAYLTARDAIPVTPDVGFNVLVLKPGQQNRWDPEEDAVRLCSMATGKLRVKMEDSEHEFQVGPNGLFKVRPGAAVLVTNRLYVDAVVHVTTVRVQE